VQQRAIGLAHVAVGEFDLITPDAHPVLGMPGQHAVVGDVAPQQLAALFEPHRAFTPDGACAELLQGACASSDVSEVGNVGDSGKTRVQNFDGEHDLSAPVDGG
jgi:hypothetical protein